MLRSKAAVARYLERGWWRREPVEAAAKVGTGAGAVSGHGGGRGGGRGGGSSGQAGSGGGSGQGGVKRKKPSKDATFFRKSAMKS